MVGGRKTEDNHTVAALTYLAELFHLQDDALSGDNFSLGSKVFWNLLLDEYFALEETDMN